MEIHTPPWAPRTFQALALGKQWSQTMALVLKGPLRVKETAVSQRSTHAVE